MGFDSRFGKALAAIDALNATGPEQVLVGAQSRPKEVVYGERMSAWLEQLRPEASPELQLAVRAQHVARWRLARGDYPMDRTGYRAWRKAAGIMHAELARELVLAAGYDAAFGDRVAELVQKARFKVDPDAQTVEDVACLVFLEHYFAEFAAQHPDTKVVDIVRKTWAKMSDDGHLAAFTLPLAERERGLVALALAEAVEPGLT